MSEMISFDDLDNIKATQSNKPFFAIDLQSDSDVLNWLKEELASIKSSGEIRLERAKNNYLRYKGIQYFNDIYQPRTSDPVPKKYTPQLVLPLISDSIDETTSRLMELKPGIVVLPMNDEAKDKVDAKVAKKFLSHIDRLQKLDHKYQKLSRNAQVAGESFLWVRWNPDLGDKVEGSDQIKSTEEGQQVQAAVFQGDAEVVHKTVNWLFYQNAESWDKVDYCYIVELDYVEAMKLDYPEVADKITEDSEAKVFDFDKMEQIDLKGMCRKVTFYHKATKYMPNGYESCFTLNTVLKKGPLDPCYDGQLPIVRLIDIENDEELHGQSHIDKTKGISSNANNILNSIIKMFMLAGYAKWFVEAGAVDDNHLNNDIGIVKVKPGAKAPVLAQANPVGQGHFTMVDKFIELYYKFSKSNSIVRGEPPPGVTAGVALQYVSESESRRSATSVANFNLAVREVNEKILKVAGTKYRTDDKRTMLLMGKENRWENVDLDIEALKKDYSVLIQNTNGLSDSKALRMQQVIDLADKYPDMLPREQVIEMVGFGQADKAYDIATVAARAAEEENEQMQDDGQVIEVAPWEDHITHWKIHTQSVQPIGFKQKAPLEVIQAMESHILSTEMEMIDQAMKNPMYMESLKMLVGFPMLAELPLMPPPMPIDSMGNPLPMDPMMDDTAIQGDIPPL